MSEAGGPTLIEDRQNLKSSKTNRKFWQKKDKTQGDAVITGPNNYGKLQVPHVIYASGGNSTKTLSDA